ncbi:MAG: hypothetical protein EPO09_17705 [Aquabacterium sp.]|uniref:hypothetical protein n=1 Tax=Aquabacterium sp. TaxID=1872578 RepID=UPI00121A31AC|nr:hypothetical protein [Aquabacterium sp.]TAK88759.1 MAG: hypothetical protein EPO09_17705 [Aquabacterium sp.]
MLMLLLTACGSLLPRGSTESQSGFASFESARDAIERVKPYETTVAQLKDLGFDVQASANVRQIPYPEVVARLAPNPSVPLAMLDPGIRDCIEARQLCRAYEFSFGRQNSYREGSFWADFLNFRRRTEITGWRFQGLIVARDGVVLFRNYGGEPQIKQTERQSNPLGPLQPAGEAAGALIKR